MEPVSTSGLGSLRATVAAELAKVASIFGV
jgi:hypothetical protein